MNCAGVGLILKPSAFLRQTSTSVARHQPGECSPPSAHDFNENIPAGTMAAWRRLVQPADLPQTSWRAVLRLPPKAWSTHASSRHQVVMACSLITWSQASLILDAKMLFHRAYWRSEKTTYVKSHWKLRHTTEFEPKSVWLQSLHLVN